MPTRKRTWASPREFGAQRTPPVTRQAVMRALATGRLSAKAASKTDAGAWRINVELGNQEWDAWTNPTKSRAGQKDGGRPAKSGELFGELEHERLNHAQASAHRVTVDAKLKELDLEERMGRLVDREEVQREAFTLAREVRDALQQMPDALAPELHAARSIQEVHHLLAREIAAVLEVLARGADGVGKGSSGP